MKLALMLIIFFIFIAIIFFGRYTEYSLRRKVAKAVGRIQCPGCRRPMGRVKISPLRKRMRRSNVAVPQAPFPSMYQVTCLKCGKSLTCEIERGGIRFY
jgi:hypothetical protein